MYEMMRDALAAYVTGHERNRVQACDAISGDMIGMTLWEEPLLGIADAGDPLFRALQDDDVVAAEYPEPSWWLPGAKRVVSFFLPFTRRIKASNENGAAASPEWLHGRIEGQEVVELAGAFLCRWLAARGYKAVMPATDKRFAMLRPYASNWSERHTAYICGLGTFGASKGLITAKGVAGRFGSVVTDCHVLAVTQRPYEGVYEYCTQCRACAEKCPARAIDLRRGLDEAKSQEACSQYVASSWTEPQGMSRKRRYGCGKCQVGVPCADRIPGK